MEIQITTIYPLIDSKLEICSLREYLVPVGLERYQAIREKDLLMKKQDRKNYLTVINSVDYYVSIISANYKWEITVEKVS